MIEENFLAQHARELGRVPETHKNYGWAMVGNHPKYIGVNVRFGETDGVYSRGKRKGSTRWKKGPSRNDITVFVTEAAHDEWLVAQEGKTGKCHECKGTGQQWAGWSKDEGHKHRPCPRCTATGIAPHLAQEVAA